MTRTDRKTTDVTLRMAGYADGRALVRLAALDSARVPDGPLVVAEHQGELVAALPMDGGPPIADPFRRTAEIVQMLELRAAQVRASAMRSTAARGVRGRLEMALPSSRPS